MESDLYKKNDNIDKDVEYKIILAGESMVGKTALFQKIFTNCFKENNIPTLGINKRTIELEIKFLILFYI